MKQDLEAIEYYDLAIETDPTDLNGYHDKSVSLVKLTRNEEAIIFLDKIIKLKLKASNAYLTKGNALDEMQRYAEAIEFN